MFYSFLLSSRSHYRIVISPGPGGRQSHRLQGLAGRLWQAGAGPSRLAGLPREALRALVARAPGPGAKHFALAASIQRNVLHLDQHVVSIDQPSLPVHNS